MFNYKIPLFYWSEIRFTFKKKENYGDLLSRYLVEKISGYESKWVNPNKPTLFGFNKRNFLAIGSILHNANKNSIVWGSGIIDHKQQIVKADFRAVRGPETRKFLLKKGYNCPEIYGDPAILLPLIFFPNVKKRYSLGIIPHYNDYHQVIEMYKEMEDVLVIDLMTLDVEEVTSRILSCEKTISSSLHGLIVSHSYGIPGVWVKFSNKIFGNDIKYKDYLDSVEIDLYKPKFLDKKKGLKNLLSLFESVQSIPEKFIISNLQEGLLKSFPMKKKHPFERI
jgi:pyruvyltransferase